jgi:hypothetical protein
LGSGLDGVLPKCPIFLAKEKDSESEFQNIPEDFFCSERTIHEWGHNSGNFGKKASIKR